MAKEKVIELLRTYTMKVWYDGKRKVWYASYPDLINCRVESNLIEDLIESLFLAGVSWFETAEVSGWQIPAPSFGKSDITFEEAMNIKIEDAKLPPPPKSVHETIQMEARTEPVTTEDEKIKDSDLPKPTAEDETPLDLNDMELLAKSKINDYSGKARVLYPGTKLKVKEGYEGDDYDIFKPSTIWIVKSIFLKTIDVYYNSTANTVNVLNENIYKIFDWYSDPITNEEETQL